MYLKDRNFDKAHIWLSICNASNHDPMVDPFERIRTGWRFLVSWLKDRDFKEPDFKCCENANCLEEVKMIDGTMVMDIYIPIDAI